MDELKVKQFVAKKLHEGVKLTDIQKMLADELDCKMTFLDLRLLAADLEDVDWQQFDAREPAAKQPPPTAPQAVPGDAADALPVSDDGFEDDAVDPIPEGESTAAPLGPTKVEISRLARPGALAHGSVEFASGAKAEWLVDDMGRLGLDKVVGQPTEADFVEFQKELRRLFEQR